MAIREIEFEVTEDSIIPATEQDAGVQGEHRATQLIFTLENWLYQQLRSQCSEGERLIYRFDVFDGMGGKTSYDTAEITEQSIYFVLEEELTRKGGRASVYLIITKYNDVNETGLEMLSRAARIRFENLPEGNETKDFESFSTLADVAKRAAARAEAAAEEAVTAEAETKMARFNLENDGTVVFDGGDAKGRIDIDLVVDGKLSATSENPVANKVLMAKILELQAAIDNVPLRAHPVDSWYFSDDPTNPGEIFGGTWVQLKGRFLYAVNDGENAGILGGEREVTLTENEMPAHNHELFLEDGRSTSYYHSNVVANQAWLILTNGDGGIKPVISNAGDDKAHNNMPPYYGTYAWRRIA